MNSIFLWILWINNPCNLFLLHYKLIWVIRRHLGMPLTCHKVLKIYPPIYPCSFFVIAGYSIVANIFSQILIHHSGFGFFVKWWVNKMWVNKIWPRPITLSNALKSLPPSNIIIVLGSFLKPNANRPSMTDPFYLSGHIIYPAPQVLTRIIS